MRFVPGTTITSILILASGSLLLAQHGGGAHGAASHAGVYTGIRAPTLPAPLGLQHQASEFTAINRGALHSRPERRERRARAGSFLTPYYYLPFDYGSSFYDPSGYGSGYGAGQDPGEQTAEVTANLLGEQMQRLSNEVEQLRSAQQPAAGPYLPQGYVAQPAPQEDPPPAATPVILVLRNGQQVQVQNYAVMDKTFWDFSKQPARRIPLSTIDIAASSKATAASGGDFPQIEETR